MITSAAPIMVVVFGAFALGDFVLVKILGVALAAAVVLDATLVRLALGPALLALAGRWNWWPGERGLPKAALPSSSCSRWPAPPAPSAPWRSARSATRWRAATPCTTGTTIRSS